MQVSPEEEKVQYDANFKGPIDDRKFHDKFWCVAFAVFWVGMVCVGGFALANGNPSRLANPTDTLGNVCGADNRNVMLPQSDGSTAAGMDLRDAPYLFMPDAADTTTTFCIAECPTTGTAADRTTCAFDTSVQLCEYGASPGDGIQGPCHCPYASAPKLGRCVATGTSSEDKDQQSATSNDVNNRSLSDMLLSDLAKTWPTVLLCTGLAVGLSFAWLWLLKKFAQTMVWATIVLIFTIFLFSTYYCIDSGKAKEEEARAQEPVVQSELSNAQTMQYFGYFLIACDIVLFLVLFVMVKRIKIAIGIIKEASKALQDMPMLVLFPFVIITGLVVFFTYWVSISVYLSSAGKPVMQSDGTVKYEGDQVLQNAQLYHLFGMYWTTQFMLAVGMCTVAGAVAGWYWSRDKSSLPDSMVKKAFVRTLRYHSGSLAFGSFIIAMVKFIKAMLKQAERQMRSSQNVVAVTMLKVLQCCFTIVEKVLKFLNRNAYIEIAVYGYSFCKAARRAFHLITRNILIIAAVNVVGDFLLFLGKMFITMTTMAIASVILRSQEGLSFYLAVVLLVGVIAYYVSSGFMAVFEMAIDTILLSFCEDRERNDGSSDKPYFMSDELRQFVEKNQKKQAAEGGKKKSGWGRKSKAAEAEASS